MVTKSLISPQQKHGSSRNFKLKLINDYQINVCKDLCTYGTTRCVNVHAHIYDLGVRAGTSSSAGPGQPAAQARLGSSSASRISSGLNKILGVK